MSIKDWWQRLSPPNNRSSLLLWVVITLILVAVMLSYFRNEYMLYPLKAFMAAIIFGVPIYLTWLIFKAIKLKKELSEYKHVKLTLGLAIMSITALIWLGALILLLIGLIRGGGEAIPFGIFIVPALIFGAIGESLTKSAFPAKKTTNSISPS